MEKKAPEIQTLLSNADLWELMLGHYKTCKFRDSYFARCSHNLIRRVPGAKTCEQYPDDVFVVLGRELHPHTAQSHPQYENVSSSIHIQSLEAKQ